MKLLKIYIVRSLSNASSDMRKNQLSIVGKPIVEKTTASLKKTAVEVNKSLICSQKPAIDNKNIMNHQRHTCFPAYGPGSRIRQAFRKDIKTASSYPHIICYRYHHILKSGTHFGMTDQEVDGRSPVL